AVRHYEEALRINPDLTASHAALASILLRQGKLDEAERHAEAARKLDPREPQAWYNLGVVCALRGQGDEALKTFREAARIQPHLGRYAYAFAQALEEQGQSATALIWYRWSNARYSDWLRTANETTWALATRPDTADRNGPLAVWLARQACEATGQENP